MFKALMLMFWNAVSWRENEVSMFWKGSASDCDESNVGYNDDSGVGYNDINDYGVLPWP